MLNLLVLVASLFWYGRISRSEIDPNHWWLTGVSIAAWSGVLVGYDTLERWRTEGALRTLLLCPVSPLTLTSAFTLAGSLVGAGVITAAVGAALLLGDVRADTTTMVNVLILFLGNAAFVAFAQVLSVTLPRDVAAVLALGTLMLGSRPLVSWLPAGLPPVVDGTIQVLLSIVPTTYQLGQAVSGSQPVGRAAAMCFITMLGIAVSGWLLSRPTLTLRPASPLR